MRFLLASQRADGSWHVRSRSRPFQIYFESGFPHGKDQFISVAASGWAAAALGVRFSTPVFDGASESDIRAALEQADLPADGKTTLYDGRTGDPFDQPVTVGQIYMLKLVHLVEDKWLRHQCFHHASAIAIPRTARRAIFIVTSSKTRTEIEREGSRRQYCKSPQSCGATFSSRCDVGLHSGSAMTGSDPTRKSAGLQRSLFREAVGAGFKPALLRLTPLARYSLGHPPTAQDYSRCKHESDLPRGPNLLRQGGFETRPYMSSDPCAT